ncbi:hypothetical protein R3P38DRAFT_3467101 [Favolaschia claudopus]|uniref:Uncharacterized protein n=1 Tax=Favolaschia claudopus TaxID=2862362 RepID=A0AAW0CJR6_9AGAR
MLNLESDDWAQRERLLRRRENIESELTLSAPAKEWAENQQNPSNRGSSSTHKALLQLFNPHCPKIPNMQLSRSIASLFAVVSFAAATALPRAAESDASILAALPKFVPEAGLPEVPAALVKQLFSSANTGISLTKRSVHCETSGGSPSTGDAQAASRYIQSLGHGHSCCQNNQGGSWCTTMYCSGSACGEFIRFEGDDDANLQYSIVGICNNSAGVSLPGCDFCAMTLETDCSTSRTAALPAGALEDGRTHLTIFTSSFSTLKRGVFASGIVR